MHKRILRTMILSMMICTTIISWGYCTSYTEGDPDSGTANRIAKKLYEKISDKPQYDQLVYFDNWLVDNVQFDNDVYRQLRDGTIGKEYDQYASSALIENKCLSIGYAKGFKLLCDKAKIPCIIINGKIIKDGDTEPHAWNAVYVADKWLTCDISFNDLEGDSKKYFLINKEVMDKKRTPDYTTADQDIQKEYKGLPPISTFTITDGLDLSSIGGPKSEYVIFGLTKRAAEITGIAVLALIITIFTSIAKLKNNSSGYR